MVDAGSSCRNYPFEKLMKASQRYDLITQYVYTHKHFFKIWGEEAGAVE